MLTRIIVSIISNAVALYVASRFVPGIHLTFSFLNLLKAGALLGFVNTFIKPILKAMSLPVMILTLGLFTIIINMLMLYIVDFFFDFFSIRDIFAALIGTIVISIVNYFMEILFGEED